ncbi:MAG: hypothetical protein LBB20_02815 [Puniceicoccales bacterium]|jgi:general secretion pathway protein D|nr:hypothetical protein [Puniceicoccales bacterium]
MFYWFYFIGNTIFTNHSHADVESGSKIADFEQKTDIYDAGNEKTEQSMDGKRKNYDKLDRRSKEFTLIRARSLCFNSDYEEAFRLVSLILEYEPDNKDALYLKALINRNMRTFDRLAQKDYLESKTEMMNTVDKSWESPKIIEADIPVTEYEIDDDPIIKKLSSIVIPKISFNKTPLSHVIETIIELSEQYDKDENKDTKGVNIVLIRANEIDPCISLNLRALSLGKVLNFVARASNFQLDIEDNAIMLTQAGSPKVNNLETKFFTISRSTIIRMTGLQDDQLDFSTEAGSANAKKSKKMWPKKDKNLFNKSTKNFAEAPAIEIKAPKEQKQKTTLIAKEEKLIKQFLQHAGVNFVGIEGSDIAYDGTQLIVTQTPRNIKRVAEILRKYNSVKQVEIETKFLEVQQGVLDELNFNWTVSFGKPHKEQYLRTGGKDSKARDALRSLGSTFGLQDSASGEGSIVQRVNDSATNTTRIEKTDISNTLPSSPSGVNLGMGIGAMGAITGVYNSVKVNLLIKALEQQSGSNLMSAPKLTVLSGKTAKITVAQEFIYPRTYSAITSDVGSTTSATGTGAAGVTITAGTPSDFTTRNLGVEMSVTPVVEENNCISMRLEPRVTEFEKFIEYGGRSIAISGDTTVNIPSGFLQPIFSTREIKTEVTVFDGATVVMGGLTREEIKEVHDKIPILGDIPLVGKLFRSKGETSQKKNLLIFVTANILSPGGVPLRHAPTKNNRTNVYKTKLEGMHEPPPNPNSTK